MIRPLTLAVAACAVVFTATVAEARSRHRYPPGYWHERDWENRRDARRAGLATAIVVSGVSRAAQQNRIEQRYRDCLRGTYYDVECDRIKFAEESEARKRARRSAVVAGVVAREIVRD